MKYYIIAGEASGDLHAANLIKELKKLDSESVFRCWGGDLMEQQGATLVRHYRDLAFMGFLEVVANLLSILGNLRYCKRDILEFQPDVIILVDYPGFNLRIARFAKKHHLKVFYYISPQIWAWRTSRVNLIKKYINQMFVILPFEKEFYQEYSCEVDYVGHPLLDVITEDRKYSEKKDFIASHKLNTRPIVALLPGSRKQEIKIMLKTMLTMVPAFKTFQFVVAGTTSIGDPFYRKMTRRYDVKIVYNQTYDLLKHSYAALVTSGTATLEAGLLGVPQVVCYKGSRISYIFAKELIKVPYISLVNLIMKREVVKELIQDRLTETRLTYELKNILDDDAVRNRIIFSYENMRERLGGKGASARTASLMIQYLRNIDV
jgi:lipid-A-disaccharide synthase